jgi:hypothetical protein
MEAILDAGKPYTSGPQWLAEHVLLGRHVLAVAGTHGKTTTTSMLAWVLEQGGKAPGFLVGGVPLDFGVSARLGDGPAFVIEADEYDTAFFDKRSKFVHYRPRTAVLNNLEFDHADIFDDLAAIERQFHHLVRTVPGTGRLVVNATEDSLRRVLAPGLLERTCALRRRRPGHRMAGARRARRLRRAVARRGGRPCRMAALGPAQPDERAGRHRRGRTRGRRAGGSRPGTGELPQRAPAHGTARHGRARRGRDHRLRRLRPSPDRHSHHPGRPAKEAGRRRQAK